MLAFFAFSRLPRGVTPLLAASSGCMGSLCLLHFERVTGFVDCGADATPPIQIALFWPSHQPIVAADTGFLVFTCLSVVSSCLLSASSPLRLATNIAWWLRQLLVAGSNEAGTALPPS